MIGQIRILDGNDDAGLEALAQSVRDWEPRLDLYRLPRDARIFEPDGTLYAIALGDGMTVMTGRRARAIGRGDALVVPQGLALEVEPAVDLLGIRHDGPPPDHFRERFLQVWGFEHFPAPPLPDRPGMPVGITEVIATSDVRFRLPYAVWDLPAGATGEQRTGLEAVLLIGLAGEPRLLVSPEGARTTLHPGTIAAIGPGQGVRVEGSGRLGRWTLPTELAHGARRRARDRAGREPRRPEDRPDFPRTGTS